MEAYSNTNISTQLLLSFVFNKLDEVEMNAFETFLQANNFYAEVVDDLIDLVAEQNFSYEEANAYLQKNESNDVKIKAPLKLRALYNKFNILATGNSLKEFGKTVAQWFLPKPPLEYKVALMGSNLKVTLPIDEQNYTTEIEFALGEPVVKNDRIFLTLFESGNEMPVFETEFKENQTTIKISIEAINLHPGIYYWCMQALQTGAKAEGQFFVNQQLNPFE